MLYLALAVFFNLLLLVIIKYFERFKIPSIQGIVVNYFVAGTTALLFSGADFTINEVVNTSFFSLSFLLGALFIAVFYSISVTAQHMGMAVASVANKMSVVIPVVTAFVLYNDKITSIKIIAILIALASVYFATRVSNDTQMPNKKNNYILFPVFVFLGSGIIDALVNYANKRLIHSEKETALFSALLFFVAGLIGLLGLLYLIFIKKHRFQVKSILGGILLGIPNFFSIYFILKALETNFLDSSSLYAVLNVLIVILSALVGYSLFAEKLNKINLFGIVMAIIAIILIMI
jgi:drug/metabolite transporter (DMT)-like permease